MSEIPTNLHNRHEYGETYTERVRRHRAQAERNAQAASWDLPDDRQREYEPVPWWAIDPSFKTCASPESLVMVGSRSTDAVPATHPPAGTAGNSAAGGLGGSLSSPAAHPTDRQAA